MKNVLRAVAIVTAVALTGGCSLGSDSKSGPSNAGAAPAATSAEVAVPQVEKSGVILYSIGLSTDP